MFLWLAGIAMVLSAEAACRRGVRRDAALAGIQRGLEIFILGYLFRLQALVVTPGGPLITFFRVDILERHGPLDGRGCGHLGTDEQASSAADCLRRCRSRDRNGQAGRAAIYGLSRQPVFSILWAPLEKLGRSSLFVYWIHVELVYGYGTWFLRHSLTLWQTASAYVVFCALMYAAVLGRDRLLAGRCERGLVTEVLR